MSKGEKERLYSHEWLTISGFTLALLLFVALSWQHENSEPKLAREAHHLVSPTITINIQGAVENPGIYHLPRGSTIKVALKKAKLSKEALTDKIKFHRKLKGGEVIQIPQKEYITINLTGAIEPPTAFTLLKGTKSEELWKQVKFKKNANIKKLPKKRKLLKNQTIHVPVKKRNKPIVQKH